MDTPFLVGERGVSTRCYGYDETRVDLDAAEEGERASARQRGRLVCASGTAHPSGGRRRRAGATGSGTHVWGRAGSRYLARELGGNGGGAPGGRGMSAAGRGDGGRAGTGTGTGTGLGKGTCRTGDGREDGLRARREGRGSGGAGEGAGWTGDGRRRGGHPPRQRRSLAGWPGKGTQKRARGGEGQDQRERRRRGRE